MENNLFGGEDYEYLSVEEDTFILSHNVSQGWEEVAQAELRFLKDDLNKRSE